MSYYLSKNNSIFIVPYIKLLQSSKKDEEFIVKSPKRFAYILRNAFHLIDKTLLDKYSIRTRDTKVVCVLKLPDIVIPTTVIDNPQTVYEIATYIIQRKPTGIIIFNHPVLEVGDFHTLVLLLEDKSYTAELTPDNILTIREL